MRYARSGADREGCETLSLFTKRVGDDFLPVVSRSQRGDECHRQTAATESGSGAGDR